MRLDIVMPAPDEEHRIDRLLTAYRTGCPGGGVRLLVGLDRHRDGTAGVVGRHRAADPRVELYQYPGLGRGGALRETLRRCDADLVAVVDPDSAIPPDELLRLAHIASQVDGAMATGSHPADTFPPSPSRRWRRGALAFAVRTAFRLPYRGTACSAIVLRREVVAAVLPFLSSRDVTVDLDLLLVATALRYRIVEVPTVGSDGDGGAGAARRSAASLLRLWLHHRVLPLPDRVPVPPPFHREVHLEEFDRVPA